MPSLYKPVETKYEIRKGEQAYWGSDQMPYTMETLRGMEQAGYLLYCQGKRVKLSAFKDAAKK